MDDHPVVHFGIKMLLEPVDDMLWCGEARDVKSALRAMRASAPDITVLDLTLGGRDKMDLLKEVLKAAPKTKVLIYSSLDEAIYAPRAFRLGALGYVKKSDGLEILLEALRALARGEVYAGPAMLRLFARGAAKERSGPLEQLSDRELHVYRLLGDGMRPRRIAEELVLSVKTIHTYCDRLKQKLKAQTLEDLLRQAREDQNG